MSTNRSSRGEIMRAPKMSRPIRRPSSRRVGPVSMPTWLSIRVELIEGRGVRYWPRPGRLFAAAKTHSYAQLATAIDDAFARWDRSHLHEFELADGTRIGLHWALCPAAGRGALRPHLSRERGRSPAHGAALPDHHWEDRAFPQDASSRVRHQADVPQPEDSTGGIGRMG